MYVDMDTELFLIRSDKDKDKEESDKKTIRECREYKDNIIHFLVNWLMEVMSISDKITDLVLRATKF